MIVAPETANYSIGATAPARVIRPETVEALQAALHDAAAERTAIVPWGGGTRQGYGAPPERYDIALDLGALDGVTEYEPADLTITVQAGARLADVQALLAANNQMLALDSPVDDRATIGGTLAAGLAGPVSHRFGGPRERLIGLRAALVDGTVIHSGGRVVKNVAGYDLARLFVGSLGTLGVITEASFKLAARPAIRASALLRLDSVARATSVIAEIQRLDLPLRALEVGAADGSVAVLADCSGRQAVVDRIAAEFRRLGSVELLGDDSHQAAWRAWRDQGFDAATTIVRMVARPDAARGIAATMPGTRFQWRPGTGVIRAFVGSPDAHRVPALIQAATSAGGHAVIEHASEPLPKGIVRWPAVAAEATMRRLRDAFDPDHILNPGRFISP